MGVKRKKEREATGVLTVEMLRQVLEDIEKNPVRNISWEEWVRMHDSGELKRGWVD